MSMSHILKTRELGNGMSAQAGYLDNELVVSMILNTPHKSLIILRWYPDSESKALKKINSLKKLTPRNVKTVFQRYVDSAEEIIKTEWIPETKFIKKRSSKEK